MPKSYCVITRTEGECKVETYCFATSRKFLLRRVCRDSKPHVDEIVSVDSR